MPSLLGAGQEYSALWSLSVEEQFYLLWPLIIRKLSRRRFTYLCIAIVLLTPALRFALLYGPHVLHDIHYKTWAVADFFAAGALLALAARLPHLHSRMHQAIAPLLLTGVSLFALQHILPDPTRPTLINLGHATHLEPWLLSFSGFVLLAFLHPGIATHTVSRPLIFLAKISYGLYLCHPISSTTTGRSTRPQLPPSTTSSFCASSSKPRSPSPSQHSRATPSRHTFYTANPVIIAFRVFTACRQKSRKLEVLR
jgi:peptidoglycan/LPS O-acetylase OafA/YrhL